MVLQAAGVIFPALHLPSWALTVLVVVAILGSPLVLDRPIWRRPMAAVPAIIVLLLLAGSFWGLRAHMAHDAGRPAEGLRLLEELEVWPVWLAPAVVVPYVARGNERYLRGVLLAELGRDEEALAWLESLGQLSVMEIPLGALAHLRRAEIHERRGELDRAAEQRERFRELWREADPEFRSGIEGA